MRRYSEAVRANLRKRMGPPMRQWVAQMSAELGIHVVSLQLAESLEGAWRGGAGIGEGS